MRALLLSAARGDVLKAQAQAEPCQAKGYSSGEAVQLSRVLMWECEQVFVDHVC